MNPTPRKIPFDVESIPKTDLVRIVQRALSHPEDFLLWLRRELSSMRDDASFQREIDIQIQVVFGNFDGDTDASELIISIREAVESGVASADQGVTWTLEALETADKAIANHEDCEFEYSRHLEDLVELALDFLRRSSQSGKDLARNLLSLLALEFTRIPAVDLAVFARRLGAEGFEVLRSALESKTYPDRQILSQIYELQLDRTAWLSLKLGSSNPNDQIAALEWIKGNQSPRQAIDRAACHLKVQETARSEALSVREWWYRERLLAGDPRGDLAEDAWTTFQRHPCLPEAWTLLGTWAKPAGSWDHFRKMALDLLEKKENDTPSTLFREALLRIARSEGRKRDAWEIARRGLSRSQMVEAIALAAKEWPDEAREEFDRILTPALRGLERTTSQGLYRDFADLLGKGKHLFGKTWLAIWQEKVNEKFPKRPKLLQIVANA